MEEDFDPATMDACLIASAQRSEHYEMAAYGTLVAWAKAMGHSDAVDLLQSILDEEKATDEKLNELAEGGINQQAVAGATEDDSEEEEQAPAARKRSSGSTSAKRGGRSTSAKRASAGRSATSRKRR